MYPPILLTHPDIAELMLKPRYRVMSQAKANSEKSGNKGMRFPWEQGVTGMYGQIPHTRELSLMVSYLYQVFHF